MSGERDQRLARRQHRCDQQKADKLLFHQGDLPGDRFHLQKMHLYMSCVYIYIIYIYTYMFTQLNDPQIFTF